MATLSGESQAVLIKYAIIAVAGYLAYTYVSKKAGEVIDFTKNIDLNPFDSQGTIGSMFTTSSYHREAMAKAGKNIDGYYLLGNYSAAFGLPMAKLPAGTMIVTENGKKYYYSPRIKSIFN